LLGRVGCITGNEDKIEDVPELAYRIPRDVDCAAHARAHLDGELSGRADDDALVGALLVVSELVTNAYHHGEGQIELRLKLGEERVRIEVVDEGEGNAPEIREEAEDARGGGWGLQIVETVADRWGIFEGTTHVWADVPLHRS
jgi:anti-sigma regulatory factor (Ser/Thr protein kinase)